MSWVWTFCLYVAIEEKVCKLDEQKSNKEKEGVSKDGKYENARKGKSTMLT